MAKPRSRKLRSSKPKVPTPDLKPVIRWLTDHDDERLRKVASILADIIANKETKP